MSSEVEHWNEPLWFGARRGAGGGLGPFATARRAKALRRLFAFGNRSGAGGKICQAAN